MVAVRALPPVADATPTHLRLVRRAPAADTRGGSAGLDARLLATPEELSAFDRRYEAASGHSPGLDFIGRADVVRGFVDDAGELCAGYVLNTEPPFRYLDVIPRRVRVAAGEVIDLTDTVEVTGLWIAPTVSAERRRLVYSWLFCDVLASRRPYVLGGALSAPVAAQQMRSLPNLLYRGPGVANGRAIPQAWIYWGTLQTAWDNLASGGYLIPWPAFRP